MIFHQHILTSLGEIWVVDANHNGLLKSENESRQAFEARVLTKILKETIGETEIGHKSSGAPFIKNQPDCAISISHTNNWFAIYVSHKNAVGIDIEIPNPKMIKLKNHFLSQQEIASLELSSEHMQIYWGIKESIIKLMKGNVENYQDIQIETIGQNTGQARFKSALIQLKYAVNRQFVLVYTI